MDTVSNPPIAVDLCRWCGNVWLDGGEVEQFLKPTLFSAVLGLEDSSPERRDASWDLDVAEGFLELIGWIVEVVFSGLSH